MELNNEEIDVLIEVIMLGVPKYNDYISDFDCTNDYLVSYYEKRFNIADVILDKLKKLKKTKEREEKSI